MVDYTSTVTKSLLKPITGGSIDEWGILNYTLDVLDAGLGGTLSKTITDSTSMTAAEVKNTGYQFIGSLASAAILYWPPYYGLAVVQNSTNQPIACTIYENPVWIPAGQTIALWGYGDHFVPVNLGPRRYGFDMAAPPPTPIFLEVSDKLYITFDSVNVIFLHVASAEGLYRVFLTVTWSQSTNNDLVLYANGANYAGAFSSWGQMNTDLTNSATAVLTPPYIDSQPRVSGSVNQQDAFYFDLFFGPSTILAPPGPDTINGVGPTMADLMISTTTIAKIIKCNSGLAGGAANCVSKWHDWTTPWTSLGHMTLGYPAICSGYAVVERLA